MKYNSKLLLIIGFVLLIAFLIYLSSSFFQLLASSAIIAYFAYPLKNKILTKIKSENLASFFSVMAGMLVFAIIFSIILLSVYNSVSGIKSILAKNPDISLAFFSITILKNINFTELLTDAGVGQLLNIIQLFILIIPDLIINGIIFFLFLFYFIRYGKDIGSLIKGLVPPGEIKKFEEFSSRINLVMKSIFQAQFLTAFMQSSILFGFLFFLQIPYAFELSLFTFIMGFLNITSILVPLGLNAYFLYNGFVTGNFVSFFITVGFSIFMFFIDDFIKPFISKKIANTNPALFMLGIFGGVSSMGFTGFVIGPLVLSSLQILYSINYESKN